MDQLEQDLSRFKLPALAAVGGIAAALVVATLPAVYLEKAIGMTGIAEIISAAAPPLGNTAKALIALAAGLFSASVIFVVLNRKGGSDMSLAIRKNLTPEPEMVEEPKSKFAMPKFSLKKMLQKPKKKGKGKDGQVTELSDLPQLREVDSHPDAPARRPIFAESDLGSPLQEKIKPFEEPVAAPAAAEVQPAPFVAEKSLQVPEQTAPEQTAVVPPMAPPFQQPASDAGQTAEPAQQASAPIAAPAEPQAPVSEPQFQRPVAADVPPVVPVAAPVADPAPEPQAAMVIEPQEDMSGLSIAQLADRLETGLVRLQELERAKQAVSEVTPALSAPVAEQPAGGISVTSAEDPMQVPPLRTVETTEEDAQVARQADMDAALKAALGTLEKMTAHR